MRSPESRFADAGLREPGEHSVDLPIGRLLTASETDHVAWLEVAEGLPQQTGGQDGSEVRRPRGIEQHNP